MNTASSNLCFAITTTDEGMWIAVVVDDFEVTRIDLRYSGFATRLCGDHSDPLECSVAGNAPEVTSTGQGLRSIVARMHHGWLCEEHGGSGIGNALFIDRAHHMMPFLLACMEIAQSAARGDAASEDLRKMAACLFLDGAEQPHIAVS